MQCAMEAGSREGLLEYCAGTLDAERAAALERHLVKCEACRSFVGAQAEVWNALNEWEGPPPSADFDRRLYQRIEQEQRPWWTGWLGPLGTVWRPAAPLALASMVALAVLLLRTPAPGPAAQARGSQQVETVDADRLERTLDDLDMLRQLSMAPAGDSQTM